MRARFPWCRCGKVACPTEQQAREIKAFIESSHPESPPAEVRYYQCPYGNWHWTRKLRKGKKKHEGADRGGPPGEARVRGVRGVLPGAVTSA